LETGVPARLSAGEGRRFGLTVGAAFVALGGAAWWRGRPHVAEAALALGVLLLLGGLVVPARLGPIRRAWMRLGHALSRFTTPVFLGAVYFMVLAPVGLLMRVFGRSTLVRRPAPSFWVSRDAVAGQRQDMARQF
jgi:saxitoxin biosynthesis operon SxtJ-like protein